MMTLAFIEDLDFGVAVILSIVLIIFVILMLLLIVLICDAVIKCINKVDGKMNINPKKENKLLSEDNDAVIALLAATIDFNKEFKKDCKLKSIERIDE